MIPGITEVNFPAYATLHQATITFAEMGERVITTQVKIDGDITPDFENREWSLTYGGEKFVLNTHTPQATKNDTTRNSLVDLTFVSFPISELRRYFFVELSEVTLGTYIIDKYIASLRLDESNFYTAFNRVLNYYFNGSIVMQVNPSLDASTEVKDVELNYTYLMDALDNIPNVYNRTYRFEWDGTNQRYVIKVGYDYTAISHVFQYGYSGGLKSIERQVQDTDIYNQLLGRGGEKNLPYRYFKKTDPNNDIWAADPDAIPELALVYFGRLLDVNFRWYIRGWVKNTHRDTSHDEGYTLPDYDDNDVPADYLWAYQKGRYTDTVFSPVEYVEDAASIAEYGIRQGKLEDDDTIYPTIQGITISPYGRIDETVAIGPITDGDDSGAVETTNLGDMLTTQTFIAGQSIGTVQFYSDEFYVPAGYNGRIELGAPFMGEDSSGATYPNYAYASSINTDFTKVTAIRVSDDEEFPYDALPGGDTYKLKIYIYINKYPSDKATTREVGYKNVRLITSIPTEAEDNPMCFRVWVKNIWQTTQGVNESDLEYAARVWEPILGDRLGNEAKLVFSDGAMAISEDYEFTVVDWPKVDRTKTRNGVSSEWMLTLKKSDAEYEATGKLIPSSTTVKPVAGDHFFFTGIDMPHLYVEWAEQRVTAAKQTALNEKAYTNPTWVVQLDSERINTLEGNESVTLMSELAVGKVMTIYDPRYTGGYNLDLAIRSMTITWNDGTVINPSVEIVLSEEVLRRTPASGRMMMMSMNAAIQQAAENTRMAVMSATQKTYLSKSAPDVAMGNIRLAAGATFGNYSQGEAIEEGSGASVDETGHAEFDSMTLRKWLEVPELRFNRVDIQIGNKWNAPGGGILQSVYPDYDAQGNMLNTGTAYLKLEEGEIGAIAVDDICMGIYHDDINENSNALADADDSKGNFQFSGFYTTYFRVTQIIAADNSSFRYSIRPTSASWTQTFHPCGAMHFVAYGNFSNTNRQKSRYSTRTYERYLTGVNTWEFSAANIGCQFGELSNLSTFGLSMTGYSAYLNNIYMSGVIQQLTELPYRIEIENEGKDTLLDGDSVTVTSSVLKGWDDMTSHVSQWSIVRDSGNPTADAQWAQLTKVTTFEGTIQLEYSDLGTSGISTLFTITATMDDDDHTEVEYGFTMFRAEEGSNVFFLALTNQNAAMLYSAVGSLLSGNVVSVATLYNGDEAVSSGVTFAISASTGVTASLSGNTITVTAMGNITTGYVTVTATYDSKSYTARLNLTKLVEAKDGISAYLSSSAHSFAAGEEYATGSSHTFEVCVYKGTTKLVAGTDFTIGTLVIAPSGVTNQMMTAVANETSNVQNGTITVTTLTPLNIPEGTVTIPITAGSVSISLVYSWSLALKGSQGVKGDKGAKLRGPAEWVTGASYEDGTTTDFQDIVIDPTDKKYYICLHSVSGSATEPHLDGANWGAFSQYNYVATKVILSERGKIDNLVVNELYTEVQGSNNEILNPISIIGDTMAIKNASGEEKIKITSGSMAGGSGTPSFNLTGGSVYQNFANHESSLVNGTITLGTIPAINGENNIVTIPQIGIQVALDNLGSTSSVNVTLYAGDRQIGTMNGGGTFAQKKVSLPISTSTRSLYIEVTGEVHPANESTASGGVTITATPSGSGSVAYSAEFTMIASDGSQFRYGTEGFKTTGIDPNTGEGGAKVIQGGVEYNMLGAGVIANQGLTAPKRIIFCTAYPEPMAADVLYIKVTAQS